jgi:hypothetical protein
MWQLPAHYKFPAVNHSGSPPVARPNQLYSHELHQAHNHCHVIEDSGKAVNQSYFSFHKEQH